MSTVTRGNKGELLVKKEIAKIKEYHKIINNFTFVNNKTNSSHQIDHILIHPHGVFVIETKNYYGTIVSDTDDVFWLKIIKGQKTIISNPINQNKSHQLLVGRLLNKQYDVVSVIVFVKNNAPYVGDYNVINLKDLLLLIDTHPYQKLLTDDEINSVYKTLKSVNTKITLKEHLESIDKIKARKAAQREDMEYAIENRLCPRCGQKLEVKGFVYKCPHCKYGFDISK